MVKLADTDVTAATIVTVGIAQGFALLVAVYATANTSGGHCNPAVTIALWIFRKISLIPAILYICAQCGGAIIGSLLLKAVLADHCRFVS